jgi:CubicO group peptidase (beta-lactamase class C family)
MDEEKLTASLAGIAGDKVPGIAIAVVDADGVRATAAHGFADVANRRPASIDMVCPWFSMTKIVTATVAMRCVDRGALELDEPVHTLVPQMARLTPKSRAETITARHLLSHTAGIANPIPVKWIHPADQPGPDPVTLLDRLLAAHPKLAFDPGERSSYSNLGTLVLGQVLATITGTADVDLAQREVLDPLGMTRSGYRYTPAMETAAATGYHPRRSPMRLLLPRWVLGPTTGRWVSFRRFLLDGSSYGGLVGPVADAARFLQMHLRDGQIEGTRLITADSARAMRDIKARGRRYDLGLGWFRPAKQRGADPPFVEHLGGGAGFFNVIRIYPTRGVGIAVMGSTTTYDIDRVAALALS